MAKAAFVHGAFNAPLLVVQLSLPVELCQVPVPPSTRLLFLPAAGAPSQKLSVNPVVTTRFTWLATEVCTTSVLPGGVLPSVSPLSVSVPL